MEGRQTARTGFQMSPMGVRMSPRHLVGVAKTPSGVAKTPSRVAKTPSRVADGLLGRSVPAKAKVAPARNPTPKAPEAKRVVQRRAARPNKKRVGNRRALASRAPKAPIPGNERDDWQPCNQQKGVSTDREGSPPSRRSPEEATHSKTQYLSHRLAKEQPSIQKGKEVSRGGKP